jgi:HlyD family secretion protein
MKKRYLYLALLAAAGAAAVIIGESAHGAGAAANKTGAALAASGSAEARIVAAQGKVEPVSEEVKIGAQVEGTLREVPVEEGQRLLRGDIIAVVDNAEYAARVAEAHATVALRQAELERVVNGARQQERDEAAAAVREAAAVLENARTELARQKSLFATGDISRSDAERAEREFGVAEARLDEFCKHHAFLDAPARTDDRDRATADLELSRAQLAEAEALLAKTIVRAPFAGTVLKRYRKAGETVSSKGDTPIVAFGNDARLRVRVDVDETDVARVRLGDRAWFTAEAFGPTKFWGTVVQVGNELGKKNVQTDDPAEHVDTKILETLVELDGRPPLPSGLRMDSFIQMKGGR